MPDILYVVVPCYNEEEVLPETARRLRAKLEALMAADRIEMCIRDSLMGPRWR